MFETLNILPEMTQKGLDLIKKESEQGLVLCFPGVGSAFSKKNDQTSLIIAKDGKTMLVDIGMTIPKTLSTRGISILDFDYYHITHSHADHIGGLEELLLMSRYVSKKKPKLVITESYQDVLWEKSLKGGCEFNESGLLKFTDLITPIRPVWAKSQPREMFEIWLEDLNLVIFRTIHVPGEVKCWENAFWSTGLLIDGKVLFSGDTRFDPSLFQDLPLSRLETIFHDCQLFSPGIVHASYEELKTLPLHLRQKMFLTHYGDTFEQEDPVSDGFAGFTRAWQMFRWKSQTDLKLVPTVNGGAPKEDDLIAI